MLESNRASIPVVTSMLAVLIEHQLPGPGQAAGLLVLTAGVALAVWEGTVVGSPWAVFCCFAGTVSNGVMISSSGRLLTQRIDALRMAFYTAPVSLAALLLLYLWQEVGLADTRLVISQLGLCMRSHRRMPARSHAACGRELAGDLYARPSICT